MNISVVVPTYNGADWLPLSIPKCDEALKRAGIKDGEIVIIDDGSTDNTVSVAGKIATKYPLRIVSQKNAGRFAARKRGAEEAKYEYVLFVDTRVFISRDSLKYVVDHFDKNKDKVIWNSHVYVEKKGNIYARFWDAIAYIAWRKYFSNPRDVAYGLKDFDYYPKGTTCFFVPKKEIILANQWFEKNTKDIKTSNDDTLLIRRLAEDHLINLSPNFSCTYHARSSLRQFAKHTRHRGKVFVDGFLRKDGNRFFWPLIGFLVASIVVPVVLVLNPDLIIPALLVGMALWLMQLMTALLLGTNYKDALSLFLLSPIFAIFYGSGIWAATLKIYVTDKFSKEGV